MGCSPVLKELHLGGGTPTFFSPEDLEKLLNHFFENSHVAGDHEFSFEGHPNNTTTAHLETLYRLGFKRVSFGVQDNDAAVQRVINRIQPLENLRRVTEAARDAGYSSVNYDLIYGLPLQTLQSMETTVKQVLDLKPDRIAFYSYAHVPWTSKGQRLFNENDLPLAETKLALYQLGKKMFLSAGYKDIGMDHFALPADELFKASEEGTLHRNFMGYTTQHSSVLLGLGVSAISDCGVAFAQNNKNLNDYYGVLNEGRLPVQKGYFLSEEDVAFKGYILDLICKGTTQFNPKHLNLLRELSFPVLQELAQDRLVVWDEESVVVTPAGKSFIRNICAAFDLYLQRSKEPMKMFSKAV